MSEDDDGKYESGGQRSGEVDDETSGANHVDQRQEQAGNEHGPESEQRDEAHPADGLTRVRRQDLSFLQAPVAELCGRKQPGGEDRGSAVERRVVHRELGCVQASEQEEGCGKQHRPAQRQRCNERKKRDNGYAKPRLREGFVFCTRERQRGQGGGAGDGSCACG
jgi:hypothetical protein